ncbi:hypothetical protein BWP06_28190, partial [Enterobacter cloacae]
VNPVCGEKAQLHYSEPHGQYQERVRIMAMCVRHIFSHPE